MSGQISLNAQTEMADTFRSEGKIYVVLSVILIILICLFAFLFILDKKINRIYREWSEKKKEK